MVHTRSGSRTGDDASKPDATAADKENANPASEEKTRDFESGKKGAKRKSGEQKSPVDTKKQKKDDGVKATLKNEQPQSSTQAKEEMVQKASKKSTSSKKTDAKDEKKREQAEPKKEKEKEKEKPRLTTPDIEFEYDHSQLRDPRPTPGRKRKPQYEEFDLPEGLKADISLNFHIPKPEKPKGRLNWMQKDELSRQEGLMDPLHCFHDTYKCHEKGREGSPTYDKAGFELDWHKVDEWMKPQAYSKSRVMNSMDRALEKDARENKEICKAFFQGDVEPRSAEGIDLMHVVKDHISKDLTIPWHQIGPREAKQWERKGFEKKDFATRWHEPNPEERRRYLKMLGGASLRKNI